MSEKELVPANEESAKTISIPIHFRIPSRMPSVYAHHMTVQPTEYEVVLSFFEIVPPFIGAGDKETQEMMSIQGVTAECVSRVTISKARFPEFVAAMDKILEGMKSQTIIDNTPEQTD